VVEGAPGEAAPAVDPAAARGRARELLEEGLRTKEAARRLAAETGLSTREAYGLLLDLSSE